MAAGGGISSGVGACEMFTGTGVGEEVEVTVSMVMRGVVDRSIV